MRRLFIALAILLVASLAIPLAQQPPQGQPQQPQQQQPPQPAQTPAPQGGRGGRGGAPEGGTPGAAPKPLVPVAASTVVNNPDQYVGEYVSLTAPVETTLTKSAFAVDQDSTKSEKEILVIAPTLQNAPAANAYVTVLGELVKFDPDEVKKKTKNYTLDLTPEQIAKYKGKPAVVATAVVVNATGVDIAKVIPPPMTPEELEFQKIMRQVGPANTALRAAIEKMDAAAVKEQATLLAGAFTKTEAFWKTKNKPDATGFATEAKKHSDAINAAVAAGNWDGVKASAGPLGQQCAGCHGAYRERLDDGSFRIKMGSSSR
jgi:cytochrome c556